MKVSSSRQTTRRASTRAAFWASLFAMLLLNAAPPVLAAPSSSSQMRDTEKQRATRLRERRELQAIYDDMGAAQRRGDLKAMFRYFAPDLKIVLDNGVQLNRQDLQKSLAMQTKTRRQEKSKSTIRDFARRGVFADVKIFTRADVTMFASGKSRGEQPQQLVVEALRRETWRRTPAGWRLVFSKTLVQTMRAK